MTTAEDEPVSGVLRTLARDAHRLSVQEGASRAEVAELARRIDHIRRQNRASGPTPLARWLDSLERLVESHWCSRPQDNSPRQATRRLIRAHPSRL